MDEGSNRIVLLHEIKNFVGKIDVFLNIMTMSTDLAISNSISSFVPKYWLNLQVLVAILMNFVDKDGTTKMYIPFHPWLLQFHW